MMRIGFEGKLCAEDGTGAHRTRPVVINVQKRNCRMVFSSLRIGAAPLTLNAVPVLSRLMIPPATPRQGTLVHFFP